MSELTSPPKVPVDRSWHFPAVDESVLDNGIRLLCYECPGQYVIAVTLVFDVPLAVEPRAVEGVAGMAGRLMTQGGGGRTAEEFADALALCGADLEIGAGLDTLVAGLETPASTLGAALGVMADAVRRPTLAPEEFANEQRLRLDEIEQEKAYPAAMASKALASALFPASARRSRPSGGTTESVSEMTRDDVEAYVRRYLGPKGTTMIVAGDIRAADVQALAEDSLGTWSNDDQTTDASLDISGVSETPQVVLVDQPDAPQSTLRLAGSAIGRGDPRWAAMFVANYCVGGSFGSRINTVLREQKGLTYGADSSIQTSRGTGILVVNTAVRGDATVEAVSDIVGILRAARGTLRDDEVERAVHAASEAMALGFERGSAVAARVELLVTSDLPLDHVDTNLAALRQVTTDTASAAYDEIVEPDNLTVVVVGDRAANTPGLEAWDYGPVSFPA
jgi:zinc protease